MVFKALGTMDLGDIPQGTRWQSPFYSNPYRIELFRHGRVRQRRETL